MEGKYPSGRGEIFRKLAHPWIFSGKGVGHKKAYLLFSGLLRLGETSCEDGTLISLSINSRADPDPLQEKGSKIFLPQPGRVLNRLNHLMRQKE